MPRGLLLDPAYRAGVAQLAPLGLSYDAWLFFPQLPELFELAKANPDTRVIVNHCGGVVRIASYADKRPEVFERWSASMRTLAQLPNVYVKVGASGCASTASISRRANGRRLPRNSPTRGSRG